MGEWAAQGSFRQSRACRPRGETAGAGGITKKSHRKKRATSKKRLASQKGGGITKNTHRKRRATSKNASHVKREAASQKIRIGRVGRRQKTPRMSKGRRRHKKIAQKEGAPPQKFAAAPPLSFSQNPAQKQTRASHFKNLKRLPHFLKSAQSPAKGHFFPLFRQKLPKRGGIFQKEAEKSGDSAVTPAGRGRRVRTGVGVPFSAQRTG